MRVLVTGGRDMTDRRFVEFVLNSLHAKKPIDLIIQGEAMGADSFAKDWAEKTPGCTSYGVPADWKKYGSRAGPVRNRLMLELGKPHLVVAFKGGAGTRDMCVAANEAGVKLIFAEKLRKHFDEQVLMKPKNDDNKPRTTGKYQPGCDCDVLPWEDCEHTRAAA